MISLPRRNFLAPNGDCKLTNNFFVREYLSTGKVPQQDYDFLIARDQWLEKEFNIVQITVSRFYFQDEASATFFALKWASDS